VCCCCCVVVGAGVCLWRILGIEDEEIAAVAHGIGVHVLPRRHHPYAVAHPSTLVGGAVAVNVNREHGTGRRVRDERHVRFVVEQQHLRRRVAGLIVRTPCGDGDVVIMHGHVRNDVLVLLIEGTDVGPRTHTTAASAIQVHTHLTGIVVRPTQTHQHIASVETEGRVVQIEFLVIEQKVEPNF